jgi:histidine triad (HIT) family protein
MTDSIFTKIIQGEIPATVIYEDEKFIAINDIHPKAPIHVLLITKEPIETLEAVSLDDDDFYASLLQTARQLATQLGIQDNYKLHLNVGKKVQEVHHFHLHILGGWPDDTPSDQFSVNL